MEIRLSTSKHFRDWALPRQFPACAFEELFCLFLFCIFPKRNQGPPPPLFEGRTILRQATVSSRSAVNWGLLGNLAQVMNNQSRGVKPACWSLVGAHGNRLHRRLKTAPRSSKRSKAQVAWHGTHLGAGVSGSLTEPAASMCKIGF